MTIAERDKINEVISAMTEEQQRQALCNIKSEIIRDVLNQRDKEENELLNEIFQIMYEYQFKAFDLETKEEFFKKLGGVMYGVSRFKSNIISC